MNNKTYLFKIIFMGTVMVTTLGGCSSSKKSLLPDDGPTTIEVYDQHISGGGSQIVNTFKRDRKGNLMRSSLNENGEAQKNSKKNNQRNSNSQELSDNESPWQSARGDRIMPLNSGKSELASREMDALQRDFRKIQNPEIIGYVYPHLSNNDNPIPGYFTAFSLYTTNHYAQSGDEGQMQTVRRLASSSMPND